MFNYWIIFLPFSIVCMLYFMAIILAADSGEQTISKKAFKYSILACIACLWHLFGAVLFFTSFFGGLARWGQIEAGKYYLGHGGKLTEVSSNIYWLCHYYVVGAEVIGATAIIVACVCYCWNRSKTCKQTDKKPNPYISILE